VIVYKAYRVFLLNDVVMNSASEFVVKIMFIYKIFTRILRLLFQFLFQKRFFFNIYFYFDSFD